jgi:hypothetical protein
MPVSQRILHDRYGLGTISEVDSQYTTIEFDEHGRKKFVTSLLSLQASDTPAPTRRRGGRSRAKKTTTS